MLKKSTPDGKSAAKKVGTPVAHGIPCSILTQKNVILSRGANARAKDPEHDAVGNWCQKAFGHNKLLEDTG
jgi:hypothetical protein